MTDESTKKSLHSIKEWQSELFSISEDNKTRTVGKNPMELAVLLANRSVKNLKNDKTA